MRLQGLIQATGKGKGLQVRLLLSVKCLKYFKYTAIESLYDFDLHLKNLNDALINAARCRMKCTESIMH